MSPLRLKCYMTDTSSFYKLLVFVLGMVLMLTEADEAVWKLWKLRRWIEENKHKLSKEMNSDKFNQA